MSSSHEHRIMMLEGKLGTLTGEINSALKEMAVSMEALTRGNKLALSSLQAQIEEIRNHLDFTELADEEEIRQGKEI